jgi:hypothetical protein
MTNKGLRDVAKIISMVVNKEMKVDNMEALVNSIYTGLFVVMNTDKDEKIKKLFKGLALNMPPIKPRLTEGFKKFLKNEPVIKEVKIGGKNIPSKLN